MCTLGIEFKETVRTDNVFVANLMEKIVEEESGWVIERSKEAV